MPSAWVGILKLNPLWTGSVWGFGSFGIALGRIVSWVLTTGRFFCTENISDSKSCGSIRISRVSLPLTTTRAETSCCLSHSFNFGRSVLIVSAKAYTFLFDFHFANILSNLSCGMGQVWQKISNHFFRDKSASANSEASGRILPR